MATGGVFGYAESDSEDELPSGWEERTTLDCRVFYANHAERLTQWTHPRTGKKKKLVGDLPPGWIREADESGTVVFKSEKEGRTTYTDPRLAFAVEDKDSDGKPRQRFDGSTKALQVLHGVDLSNQTIAVTGANSGIGFETARSFALHGAHVVMICRNMEAAEIARLSILKERPKSSVDLLNCDLSSLRSAQQCARQYHEAGWPLHVLILNAGVFAVPFGLTTDGYERTFQVNHLSQFYLLQLLRPILIRSAPGRVVFVSSESHRFAASLSWFRQDLDEVLHEPNLSPKASSDYWYMAAYNQSKLCNVIMAFEMNRQLAPKGITCNALHPGNMIFTGISRHSWLMYIAFGLVRPFVKSLQQGAATTVFVAAASEVDGIGGKYFNNCWFCPPDPVTEEPKWGRKLWDISTRMIERVTQETWECLC